jgi:hypothetical protein
MLGNTSESLEIGDLPLLSSDMRAPFIFNTMKHALRTIKLKIGNWRPKPGSGWDISWKLVRLNSRMLIIEILLAAFGAVLYYTPALFLRKLVAYLESDPERLNRGWGFFFCVGLFVTNAIMQLGVFPAFYSAVVLSFRAISHWSNLVYRYNYYPSKIAYPVELDSIRKDSCPQRHCIFSHQSF